MVDNRYALHRLFNSAGKKKHKFFLNPEYQV
jgi:hypothetical protein